MKQDSGRWFGKQCYFGFHTDLHLWDDDTEAGRRALPDELEASLRLVKPDWVQVDSKGHAGYTSWFSKVPEATVAPHLAHDAVAAWREASRRLGIPLVCHYSGFIDLAAGLKHPEWLAELPPGRTRRTPLIYDEAWMCPRSDYFDRLMIPQLCELVGDYDVDGIWVDGDVWGDHGCYCPKCRAAFLEQTGIDTPPLAPEDEHWEAWWNFHFESYLAAVEKYAAAVHARKPSALVCANWLDSIRFPASGRGGADWLSGDAAPFWSFDDSRCEVRWLPHRGKSWDLMSWPHLGVWNFHLKSRDMLCQEAASVAAAGGRYIFCELSGGMRSSQLPSWRLRRLAEIGDFVRERQPFCQDNQGHPEIAVLRSLSSPKQWLLECQPAAARLATTALLECHYGVDLLDEWALLPRLNEFKVVVAPEADRLEESTVAALKRYVAGGGRLLVTGVGTIERFGAEFFGIEHMEVETVSPVAGARWSFLAVKDAEPLYFLPDGDGVFPLASPRWGLLETRPGTLHCGELFRSYIPEESGTGYPAAVVAAQGEGVAAALPADFFTGSKTEHFLPDSRRFLGRLMRMLYSEREIEVEAPTVIDVMFRSKDGALQIHLLNRSTGTATHPDRYMIDEIPWIGGISLTVRRAARPARVMLQPENRALPFEWIPDGTSGGMVRIRDLGVRIHAAVVISD